MVYCSRHNFFCGDYSFGIKLIFIAFGMGNSALILVSYMDMTFSTQMWNIGEGKILVVSRLDFSL
jgi:hypothetical protein